MLIPVLILALVLSIAGWSVTLIVLRRAQLYMRILKNREHFLSQVASEFFTLLEELRAGHAVVVTHETEVKDTAKLDTSLPVDHPSKETRDLQPIDLMLRKHGFKIYARPQTVREDVLWIREGTIYDQTDATALARAEQRIEVAGAENPKEVGKA